MSVKQPKSQSTRQMPPVWIWIFPVVGAIRGAFLAESGDFWGNTVPSTLTFLAVGLVLGLAAWGIARFTKRTGN